MLGPFLLMITESKTQYIEWQSSTSNQLYQSETQRPINAFCWKSPLSTKWRGYLSGHQEVWWHTFDKETLWLLFLFIFRIFIFLMTNGKCCTQKVNAASFGAQLHALFKLSNHQNTLTLQKSVCISIFVFPQYNDKCNIWDGEVCSAKFLWSPLKPSPWQLSSSKEPVK